MTYLLGCLDGEALHKLDKLLNKVLINILDKE